MPSFFDLNMTKALMAHALKYISNVKVTFLHKKGTACKPQRPQLEIFTENFNQLTYVEMGLQLCGTDSGFG